MQGVYPVLPRKHQDSQNRLARPLRSSAQRETWPSEPATQEAERAARAAWLHFIGGLTQQEVARRLDISTTRAHRYIARAQSEGRVRIFVDVEAPDCVAIERRLASAYGLSHCRVALEAPEAGPLPLRALGVLGADLLMHAVVSGEHAVIGLGHGRTLAASVAAMGRCRARETRIVSMLGGLTRSGATNPHDVVHAIAQKTGAEAYLMPVPLFVDAPEDKRILLAQSGLAGTMELIERASLVVVGIGDLDPAAPTSPASPDALEDLRRAGAVAEILGQFLDSDGQPLATPYDGRVMAPPLSALAGRTVVAIAGGERKAAALRAALKSGLLSGLIVDERTGRHLAAELAEPPPAAAG
ncbi:MAG: sugar-binding domain-containing protein [Pseudomonadota bacterium]